MVEAFLAAGGQLETRLLAALRAGAAAGGEAGPVHSAGLAVRTRWPASTRAGNDAAGDVRQYRQEEMEDHPAGGAGGQGEAGAPCRTQAPTPPRNPGPLVGSITTGLIRWVART
jgi:uncharacterized protein DUF1028